MIGVLMEPITLFSWGYWGWGNATPQLVEAVDAVETARGFRPPLFVDVRISRSVRAVGFRDHAFEHLMGRERYRWMRELGNKRIQTGTGPPLQIAEPAAAEKLVDIAREAAAEQRRLLFFCACERPIDDQGTACHRVTVARLVREAAAKRGVAVQTVEWPGGEPTRVDLDVPPAVFRAVKRGRASVPLPASVQLERLAGLAWGTVVHLRDDDDELAATSGPARFQGGAWCLPVCKLFAGREAGGSAPKDWATRFRAEHGYEPEYIGLREGPAAQPARCGLFPWCVYTIAHIERLRSLEAGGGSGILIEGKRWVSGRGLLEDSRKANLRLPIVFADSTDCSRLRYWAVLTRIDVAADETRYAFEGLQAIPGNRAPQDLVLRASGKKIAPGYIRPYALCKTPAFLDRQTQT